MPRVLVVGELPMLILAARLTAQRAPIEGDREYAVLAPGGSVMMRELADERIEALVLRFIRSRHL